MQHPLGLGGRSRFPDVSREPLALWLFLTMSEIPHLRQV
jgi:hypothetical protein